MKPLLSKKNVISLYCYCAQARNSVDSVLSAPDQWSNFLAYYDEEKRKALADLVALLKDAGANRDETIHRKSFAENILVAMIWSLAAPVFNRTKKAWSFSPKQVSFLCTTLETLLGFLKRDQPPSSKELADSRMDFYACLWIIGRKTLGITELREVEKIEFFNQSAGMEYVTLEQLGIGFTEETRT